MKISFIFCADTESSLEKIHKCDHDLTKIPIRNIQTDGVLLFIVHKLFI